VREYTFNVREAGSEREFTLSIENAAFVSHRARYQDAPFDLLGALEMPSCWRTRTIRRNRNS